MTNWPSFLRDVQTGSRGLPTRMPCASSGTLILDVQPELINVPGGLLHWVNDPVHYLDLGGIPAASLVDLGGSPTFWAGVTKLYASNGALVDVRGLQLLRNIKYLYLDNNKLPENELMVMAGMLPQGQLECLDIRGNPGLTPSVMDALLRHGVVDRCQYVNGRRLDLDLTSIWD